MSKDFNDSVAKAAYVTGVISDTSFVFLIDSYNGIYKTFLNEAKLGGNIEVHSCDFCNKRIYPILITNSNLGRPAKVWDKHIAITKRAFCSISCKEEYEELF